MEQRIAEFLRLRLAQHTDTAGTDTATGGKSVTVTAFVDEKWYQSTFKLAICTAGC